MPDIYERIRTELEDTERKAWDALARYKFWMFGYHAAQWVKLNRVAGAGRENPFRSLVKFARNHQAEKQLDL